MQLDLFVLDISPILNVKNSLVKSEALSIYPNPAGDFVKIKLPETNQAISSAQLSDLSGRIIRTINFPNSSLSECKLSVDDLVPGIYFVDIKTSSKTYTGKICVR